MCSNLGDARAYDGPRPSNNWICRLFDSYSAIQPSPVSGTLDPDGGALVRAFWQDTSSVTSMPFRPMRCAAASCRAALPRR